jgi:hypothetical protein
MNDDVRTKLRIEVDNPEPPRPLMREVPPAPPFPVDALGDVLGPAAEAINDRIQSPMAIGAQSVLAVATIAAQIHVNARLPIGKGENKPISNYLVTVAASGERKSAADSQAAWPLAKHGKTLREQYDIACRATRTTEPPGRRRARQRSKKPMATGS